MFEYMKGTIVDIEGDSLVLEVQQIGYRIHCPCIINRSKATVGEHIRLYVRAIYREDSQNLYGFSTKEEKDLFDRLEDVSGIGPKTASNLLGMLSYQDLVFAIQTSNVKLISSAPGIGKKTAERIILDLKDKLSKITIVEKPSSSCSSLPIIQDGIQALIQLGFSHLQAKRAIDSVTNESSPKELSHLITQALKKLKSGQCSTPDKI